MAEDLLTTKAAADVLHVSGETLRRWAEKKFIRHIVLPSGQLRFRRADLEEALVPVEPLATVSTESESKAVGQ